MTTDTHGTQPVVPTDGELAIEPRFTGRSFVAVLRVLVGGESVLVHKIDLAKDGARKTFIQKTVECLPAVDPADVEAKLLRLCDERAASLQSADEMAAEGRQAPTLPDLMVQIAFEEAELFHDRGQNAFAAIEVNGHIETWAVKSRGFRLWLRRRLREEQDRSASAEAVNTALEEIESRALFDGSEAETFVRLAEHDGAVWLDLCDDQWRAVRVTREGWMVVCDNVPVRFTRARAMLPLDVPQRGGSIDDLRAFLNVQDEADFLLMVAWLVACLHPSGPYPILSVNGEQGSAKSTTQKMLRSLIDPNSAPLRAEPRDERDLVISAGNSWILGFDNLSSIRPGLSDALCRLSTGGGFATRELYSDAAEVIFESKRPVLFNGITDLVNRSDLLDRSLLITLAAIPESQRRSERELWARFEKARPRILGALLDAVAGGLALEASVKLDRLPRMADFAIWITACETALGWAEGTFLSAYTDNRSSANETAMEASVVGLAVQQFMAERPFWQGTSTELLSGVEGVVDDKAQRRKDWPKSGRKMSGDLRRVAPNLRRAGLDVSFERSSGKARRRLITLARTDGSDGVAAEVGEDRQDDISLFDKTFQGSSDGADGSVRPLDDLDPDERAEWDERVAICVSDGGLCEADAEAIAWEQVGRSPRGYSEN